MHRLYVVSNVVIFVFFFSNKHIHEYLCNLKEKLLKLKYANFNYKNKITRLLTINKVLNILNIFLNRMSVVAAQFYVLLLFDKKKYILFRNEKIHFYILLIFCSN